VILRRLAELVAAESEVRRLHASLCRAPRALLLRALRAAVRHAGQASFTPADLWLLCAARLFGELEEPEAVDGLIDVLGGESPEARVEAGEQLLGLGEARFDAVAAGAARALERLAPANPALRELPYVLAETMQPRAVAALRPWLRHGNPDVVAAAIESLATLADPSATPDLEPLLADGRLSVVDQGDAERLEATVGDLAAQAIELLQSIEPGGDEPDDDATARSGVPLR
jgi:HEAT repeat protein